MTRSSGRSWIPGSGCDLAPTPATELLISESASPARASLTVAQSRKLKWWIERLRADVFAGDQISKGRIPVALAERHGLPALQNLWRFELPGGFRGLYTIQAAPGRGVVAIILEILPHKEYNRLFGYG